MLPQQTYSLPSLYIVKYKIHVFAYERVTFNRTDCLHQHKYSLFEVFQIDEILARIEKENPGLLFSYMYPGYEIWLEFDDVCIMIYCKIFIDYNFIANYTATIHTSLNSRTNRCTIRIEPVVIDLNELKVFMGD